MKEPRYPLFDIARLIFALEVVREHAVGLGWKPFFPVPAFLALSGFLVLQSYERSKSAWQFAWKRFLRITPAFLVCLVLLGCTEGAQAAWSMVLRYLSGGFYPGRNVSVWSLAWEELFYAGLVALWALGAYKRRWAIWALFVLAMVVPRLLIGPGKTHPQWTLIGPLFSAFFAGNLCYLYRETLPRLQLLSPVAILGGLLWSQWPSYLSWPGGSTLFGVGVLILGVSYPSYKRAVLPDLSYGTYLYHVPLMWLLGRQGLPMLPWSFPCVLAFAAASWYLVESPALRLKNRMPSWRPKGNRPNAPEALLLAEDVPSRAAV